MALKRGNEIPTIDVELVTIQTANNATEIALNTASKIGVTVQSETQDAVQLIIKGQLKAQKRAKTTITGNTIVLTDNVLNPEVVKILQGGNIAYKNNNAQEGIASYTPPAAGSSDKGEVFTLKAYSAIYDAAGLITGYECIEYPNCEGTPIALESEDNVFRAPEYTINSAPKTGEPPYKITYVDNLPAVNDGE